MEFEQDVDDAVVLGRLLVDLAKQLGRIDRLHHRDIGRDIFHLVCLQVADEVPLDVLRQGLHLLSQLLLVALAEDALSRLVGRQNILVGMILADGHQLHPLGQMAEHLF